MSARILLFCLTALFSINFAQAHELPENRATMVLRDDTHVSLTFYVDYPDVLNAVLAPKKTHREFLLASAAMKPEDFRQQILLVQAKLQADTHATLNGGKEATITGWAWPDAASIQTMIQKEVMESLVGPVGNPSASRHTHEAPTEIRANITHDKPIIDANIQFAEAFGKMLLVSYRPRQNSVATKKMSSLITF